MMTCDNPNCSNGLHVSQLTEEQMKSVKWFEGIYTIRIQPKSEHRSYTETSADLCGDCAHILVRVIIESIGKAFRRSKKEDD